VRLKVGLEVLNKKIQVGIEEMDDSKVILNISNLIIPFSIIFRHKKPPDIYSGEESIAFRDKNIKFQQILMSEFLYE
jgi:hypothetical protein